MSLDERMKLLKTLAQIDRISADAQLILTESGDPTVNQSAMQLRSMAIAMRDKVQEALKQLEQNL